MSGTKFSLSNASGVTGFSAALYQDFISGPNQYILSFARSKRFQEPIVYVNSAEDVAVLNSDIVTLPKLKAFVEFLGRRF